jgi:uncharacterized protein
MEFRGMETVLIDLLRTPELQRLRRVKQLGLVDFVFPSAEHSRFVHCLGAAYLAIRFSRRLQEVSRRLFSPVIAIDETVIRDVAVAALCHDLGHGPLSHAWEREIVGQDYDRNKWISSLELGGDFGSLPLKWHELVGHGLLRWPDGQLHRLLEQQEEGSSLRISELLRGRYYLQYMPRLLASDLDVDRADFIRRDTHQTGVAYGRYDLDWLISTATLGFDEDSRVWVIGFDSRKAIRVVEQFLIARRALYETVYYHKTVRCAEGLMALFLRRLRDVVKSDSSLDLGRDFKAVVRLVGGDALGPEDCLQLDDTFVYRIIDHVVASQRSDETLQDLARRISSRDLFKLVPVSSSVVLEFLSRPDAYERLKRTIKPYCPGEPEYYYHVDFSKFKMISDRRSEAVFLVDQERRARLATEHQGLQQYRAQEQEEQRIYTLREAREAVKVMIEGAVKV